ncbi:MAG TPA: DUF3592 domain-containing protein [Ignavibacteria bacterium]|nr:DUF3592 domain-containing protein [Ignavibacteria bacterium]
MNLIFAVIIIIGFLPLAIVLFRINGKRRMEKNGVKTTGTVSQTPSGTFRGINKVLIEYRINETGIIIKKEISVAGLPYKEGDKLPLYYDKNDPGKIQLDSGRGFIFMLVFTFLIAVFAVAACWMIYTGIQTGEF